jgi:hypothetical protein
LSGLFLGLIAAATLLMALVHIGASIAALRMARQAQEILSAIQGQVKPLLTQASQIAEDARPLIGKANAIADEASRTLSLATAQAQKVDKLVTDLSRRVDETSAVVQQAIVTPAREGLAIVAAVRAAFGALRFNGFRGRTGRPTEEDDPLFIG